MKIRALTLSLVSVATLAGTVPQAAVAQGLRAAGVPQAPRLSSQGPSVTLPAPGARPATRAADFIVAVVNSEPVTNNDVQIRMERARAQMQAQGVALPPESVLAKEMLERLIMEKIMIQNAKEMGMKVDDYAVSQAAKSVAQQNKIAEDDMYRRLASDGISKEQFRSELRNQMLVQRLREREVDARVKVSELDIDQFLREQGSASGRAGASSPSAANAEINLGHILIAVPEGASSDAVEAKRAKARQLVDDIRGGKDFYAAARESSDAADAAQGGLMGLRPADRYPELFVTSTQKAAVGSVVGPIHSPAGFHILKVVDRSLTGVPSVAVQSHVRHILLRIGAHLSEQQAAQRMEDYRRRIESGNATFEALAREYSQDGSAQAGGDLGWAGSGRYVPEFEQAVNALQPGQISGPVLSRFGMHLIQLLERREVKLTQREQREMVRDVVREKKLEEAYTNWQQETRSRAYVEYREPPQQ
ncbi:peptidylprolyl isomerase [Diaphorobacter ruginosibacter]|uniref:Chaperone SurA n=1 Tax=Diaphorobacter ruginosibacter TaxID=1715720 RepID=A0A7G9RMX4_9BURK|nr:peptidylprolyl isomerase [Diaphorobacter ruginosibacter]QNN56949.1 peptidylprolyl isomerase [Diaphorobacter ruginosibacter]